MEDLPIITATSSKKLDTSTNDDGNNIIEFPLPGFRFHPTDQELVGFYLKRKVFDDQSLNNRIDHLIKQLDIYKYDPWDLPKYFGDVGEIGHKEWYFFCKRGRKYKNSIRPNRVTGSGFWKATGIDRQIMGSTYALIDHPHPHKYECIGLKKSLVYYRGNAGKGVKTDWMMHEFRLPSSNYSSSAAAGHDHHLLLPQEAEVWTLCRILKRDAPHNKYTHANSIETKKDNMKSINNGNNNSSNNIDFMNVDNKSFISFTSPTTLNIKPGQNEKKRHLAPDHHHHHHQITASDQLMNSISDDNPSDPSYINFHYNPEMDHDGTHDHDQLMIKYANWDELRHVVEYFDPYHV